MPNHLHAILTPAPGLAGEGHAIHQGWVLISCEEGADLNIEIWQPGFKEHRIKDAQDYRAHAEYIWSNPVRARIVQRAEDFPYSLAKLREAVDDASAWLRMHAAKSAVSSARSAFHQR